MGNPWDTLNPAPIVNQWPLPEKPSWLTDEIKIALENNGLPIDQDGMLLLQQRAKNQLDYWKEMEMEYRKICAAFLVPTKTQGMNNIELGNGFTAKVGIKYNYKLDSDNDKVWNGLSKIENLGNEGKFVADRLVSWTPNFLLTEYRQLQEDSEKGSTFAKDALKVINEFLTITDAAPTIDIKEPKGKKKK
jgi:hypothetical protein